MQLLNQILRGAVIGVANIIPGVSGGTMMVSMGVYDTLIHCITHLFSEFKQSVKTLLPYAIGMLVGIVALASVLKFLFANYALPTSTAFIGLILGGLNPLLRKINKKKLNWVSLAVFVLFFAGIIALALTGDVSNPESLTLDMGQVIILVVMGAVAAATMIIPGVSGSMVLMLLGYYTPVLNAVDALKNAVFSFDVGAMANPFFTLLPFGVGVVLGIFGVAKLIEWLLARFPTQTYCGVLGLVVSSPIAILLRTDMTGVNWIIILISLITFALGFVAAMLLARGSGEEAPKA
ncbi:MAG: DUF368 domain-containing protein [Clostridiales bacterium]|nr:DUF368 domain-containing protein [Clostridiales bacterium]MDO4350175.1 DUF368 domain-containing protein [Eubacteriales bacterium]MDY4008315.1 DUF368 domain-containing protein [Candidatus Limiplasma sp.]